MLPYRGKIPRGDRESDILFFLSFFSSLHPLQCGQANLNQFSGNPSLKLKRASIGAQWNVSGVPPIVVEEGDANQSLISLDGAKDIRSLRDDEDREFNPSFIYNFSSLSQFSGKKNSKDLFFDGFLEFERIFIFQLK